MKKILIVDDTAFMQKAISSMLEEEYTVICASSGQEALELYEKEKPELILTDLIMPGMTGLELQQILLERYEEQIPIVFISADENEENEIRGLESGAMDYIRKPFKKEVLLRRVKNILRNVERIQGLKMEAETDPMTGLFNKAYSQEVVARLCARSNGVLMMVDLDSFKLVNDLYGHGMGDRILIRFAEILRSVIRTTDAAGRVGGDEFLLFCKDIREESVIEEKIRTINTLLLSSAKEFMGEDMTIPLGASAGAVLVPDEGRIFAQLYGKADKALYQVKQNGKHGCRFFHGEVKAETVKTPAANLENVRMVLDERSRKRGAYELGFENFRTIYRFLVRSSENYNRPIDLVLFTLTAPDGKSAPPEEVVDLFGETMGNSLRRSDVYTKNGRSQFIVILQELADGKNLNVIMNRVMENWAGSGHSQEVRISFENQLLPV